VLGRSAKVREPIEPSKVERCRTSKSHTLKGGLLLKMNRCEVGFGVELSGRDTLKLARAEKRRSPKYGAVKDCPI